MSVKVLLSTYNSDFSYLKEQIDSILSQSYPVSLHIRDDGSDLEFRKELADFLLAYPKITYEFGENVSYGSSYMSLLYECDDEYVAFSDHDDVWFPDKIKRAIDCFSSYDSDLPVMYCSNAELVDEKLRHLTYRERPKNISFKNALVQNVCQGCTIVLNKSAVNFLKRYKIKHFYFPHDWWLYLCISKFGTVIYDPEPSLFYRKHSKNALGDHSNVFYKVLHWVLFFKKKEIFISRILQLFYQQFYSDLNSEDKKILTLFLDSKHHFLSRLRLVFSSSYFRQKRSEDIIVRLFILFNWH